MRITKCLLLVLVVGCSIQFSIQDAESCSVPVFRYALERWKPDPYKGIFIYRGEITQKDQALLRQLEEAAMNPEYPLNLRIRPVDTKAFSEEKLRELLKGPIPEKLPVLAVWYPGEMGKATPLWKIELSPAGVKELADSPKRRQLTASLINGESIVWVFVPSGNSQKDEQARALIRMELDTALDTLAKTPFFVLSGSTKKKLTYGFPILTVSRSDPQERFFLDMLMHCESDLFEYKNEAMVFPVFGRGRLLGGLFGEHISKKNIQGVVSYLAAACSCEVKAQHPGMDLLLSAFWDKVVMGELFSDLADANPVPELTGVMPASSNPIKNPEAVSEKPPKKRAGVFAVYGITLGSAIVVVFFAGLILNRRRKENR
jgi:hypothetical protein